LIATSQPQKVIELVENYKNDLKSTEARYLDIVLFSGGAVSYADIMQMPVSSISLLIERMNQKTEDQNQAASRRK
jgi:hypothetical protein